MVIFEIVKNGFWSKNFFREIDSVDFTSFFGLDFFNFSGPLCGLWMQVNSAYIYNNNTVLLFMLCISFAILFLTQNSKLIASRFDSFIHGIAKAWHREQKIVSYRIELCTVAIKMSNILLNLFKIFMQCKHIGSTTNWPLTITQNWISFFKESSNFEFRLSVAYK